MDEQTAVREWPVDLRREEFVQSQQLLARLIGPLRNRHVFAIGSALIAFLLIGTAVVDYYRGSSLDWLTVIMGVSLLAVGLFTWWYVPWQIKRNAEKQYDRAVACGQTFSGVLRIYQNRIEKVGDTATASIPLDATAFFAEDSHVMVLMGRSRRAVVLPARCMTDEVAAAVRQAADALPVNRRRFVSRLQPQGQVVEVAHTPPTPPLWEVSLRYTQEEYVALYKTTLQRRFRKLAPFFGVLSVPLGFAFGWDGQSVLPCALWTVACFGLLSLLNYTLPLSRVKKHAAMADSREMSLKIILDERGVHLADFRGEPLGIPWSEVRHVYDKETYVEITERSRVLHIPKRCIEDIKALDEIVTRCRSKQ